MEAVSRLSIVIFYAHNFPFFTVLTLARRVSQLHLIKWEHHIIDIGAASFLRVGSNKGDAIRYVLAGRKTCYFQKSPDEDEEETKELSKRMATRLRCVLGVHSSVLTTSIRFDLS